MRHASRQIASEHAQPLVRLGALGLRPAVYCATWIAAPEAAAVRADELLAAVDLDGNAAWIDILARIRQLTAINPDETRH